MLDRKKRNKRVHPVSREQPLLELTSDSSITGLASGFEDLLIRYSEYQMTIKEKLIAIAMLGVPMGLIGFIFYKNVLLALIVSFIGFGFPKLRKQQIIAQRKNKLNAQFKQALSCLSSSLSAGKSVESAFRDALIDLQVLYPDPACYITSEFQIILRRIDNGEAIESAIKDFALRAELEDISSFADVFITCKRTGGNLIEVVKRTSAIISEKLEIKQDISVMVAQKRFESRVLIVAPVVIVAVLSLSSPDYMEPLYQGVGILIMSLCLVLLVGCFWLTQKIMSIKV
ncbi:Bacterial type II secretion system protein F domain protein [compost metagenome]